MKKLLLLIALFSMYLSNGNAQTIYYDVIKLKSLMIKKETNSVTHDSTFYFDLNKKIQVLQILKTYTYNPDSGTFADSDKAIYNNYCLVGTNNFICPFIPGGFSAGGGIPISSLDLTISNGVNSALNSLGNTNVSSLADAVTKFLIKRAKEELFIAFFSKLQDSTKFPEFGILFPNTKVLVGSFDSWEYPNIMNTLKEAFDKDLQQLLVDIPKLNALKADTPYNSDAIKRIKAIHTFLNTSDGRVFISAMQIGNGLITGQKIPDIIHTISGPGYLGDINNVSSDVKSAIRLLDIISYSVKSNDPGVNYISTTKFRALMDDPISKQLYLGLLYQQLKNENVRIGTIELADQLNNFRSYTDTLINKSDVIKNAITDLSNAKKNGTKDLTTYWITLIGASNQFFQSAINNIALISPGIKFPPQILTVLQYGTKVINAAHDISVKNYSAAIVDIVNLMPVTSDKKAGFTFENFIVKYGSFAANLVQAQNSDDAESAIESVVLPAGSASIKKNTNFSIAVNGYLGFGYGNEYLGQAATNKWGTITGAYAPIGITLSKRVCTSSISLFVQLIDLGAVASYRLSDPNTANLPDFTLQNILAPGLGIVYGIPNVPISIGYTYQLGPELRSITATDVVTSQGLNQRWQFFIAVDIPLFSLFTKSK